MKGSAHLDLDKVLQRDGLLLVVLLVLLEDEPGGKGVAVHALVAAVGLGLALTRMMSCDVRRSS